MKSNKEQKLIEEINNRLTQFDRWELRFSGIELTDKYCHVTFEICWWNHAGERCFLMSSLASASPTRAMREFMSALRSSSPILLPSSVMRTASDKGERLPCESDIGLLAVNFLEGAVRLAVHIGS